MIKKLHLKITSNQGLFQFTKDLGWSAIGIIGSLLILFILNVIAGRLLGPDQFGKYNLIISLSSIFSIFVIAGSDAVTLKYVSGHKDAGYQRKILINSLLTTLATGSIISIIFLIFHQFISDVFNSGLVILLAAIVLTLFVSFKNVFDAFIRGLRDFPAQSRIKIIEGLIALIFFTIIYYLFQVNNYLGYYFSVLLSTLTSIILFVIYVNKRFKLFPLRFNKQIFLDNHSYQKTALLTNGLNIVLMFSDRLIIGKYIGFAELGLYSAYTASSITIMSQVSLIITNALIPAVNQSQNKTLILKKIGGISLLILPIALPIITLLGALFFQLFGKSYLFTWNYIFLFAIMAFTQIISAIYLGIVSTSKRAYSISAKANAIKLITIALIFLGLIFTHHLTLVTVILTMIYSYIFDIVNALCSWKIARDVHE